MIEWVGSYLTHLGLEQESPSLSFLRKLVSSHQQIVPLENLDFYYGQRPSLDLKKTLEKILTGRGGIGLHLNGLFCDLVNKLAYLGELRSVAPYDSAVRDYKHRLAHIGILVSVKGKTYYVDLGTPKGISEPVEIIPNRPFLSGAHYYQWKTKAEDENLYLMKSSDALNFYDYQKLENHKIKLIEYLAEHDKYYEDQHAMTQNRWMYKRTEIGYSFIQNQLFERMEKGQVEQIRITNDEAFWSISSQHFGITQDMVLNPATGV